MTDSTEKSNGDMYLLDSGNTVISNITPNDRFGKSILHVIIYYAREIRNSREHIFLIFAVSFRSTFIGSRLGVLWNYLLPLVPLSVYLLLTHVHVH